MNFNFKDTDQTIIPLTELLQSILNTKINVWSVNNLLTYNLIFIKFAENSGHAFESLQ